MAHLSIHLLGSFQVTLDDVAVMGFESDKTRALLVYLAMEGAHPQRRETLAGLLWPNVLDASARRSLSQALFNLRQILGDSRDNGANGEERFLLVSRDTIQFNCASDYTLDVASFTGLQSVAKVTELQEVTELQKAVTLYGGDFLQGFSVADAGGFDEWATVQRERLHRCAVAALGKLADIHMQTQQYAAAIHANQRLLDLEPWHEEAHQQVMYALAQSGQSSRALAQYESCKRVLAAEFGIEPSTTTKRLYERIRAGEISNAFETPVTAQWLAQSPSSPPSNIVLPNIVLPTYLTPFLGRDRELAELAQLIADPDARLITLFGPGGMGKTRLAVQVAAQQPAAFQDGIVFVALDAVGSVAALVATLAHACNFNFSGATEPRSQLLNYLGDRQMLIVLDNFETLLQEAQANQATDFVLESLHAARQVKFLITSRESLSLPGEWVVEVGGLVDAAVALFVQSARRFQHDFSLEDEDAAVEEICRLVDQMPLAIELAAAWVQTLSCVDIAREMKGNMSFLATSSRGVPERHRSVRAIFDQTWRVLSPAERQAMCQLSVFRGAFSRDAAAQVADVSLTLLSALVTKSLVNLSAPGHYHVHALMQQYATELLREDADLEQQTWARFSAYYAGLLTEAASGLKGPQQRNVLSRLNSEWDNLFIAWEYLLTHRQISALCGAFYAMYFLHEVRGLFAEGAKLFAQATDVFATSLRLADDLETRAGQCEALAHCGWFHMRLGHFDQARAMLAQSRQLLVDHPRHSVLTMVINNQACLFWHLGEHGRAQQYGEECVALCRELGDARTMGISLSNLTNPYLSQTDHRAAYLVAREAAFTLRPVGDARALGFALMKLGQAAFLYEQEAEAERYLAESVALGLSIEYAWLHGAASHLLGVVVLQSGDATRAEAILRAGAASLRKVGDRSPLVPILVTLGDSLYQLKRYAEAQASFIEALRYAKSDQTALPSLLGIALVMHKTNQPLQALEIVAVLLRHPNAENTHITRAELLLLELKGELTPQQIARGEAKAENTNLAWMVQEIVSRQLIETV